MRYVHGEGGMRNAAGGDASRRESPDKSGLTTAHEVEAGTCKPRSANPISVLTPNLNRLLSVVNGDWSPYAKVQTVQIFGQAQPIELVYYDWELLRHDIHVALHRARAT